MVSADVALADLMNRTARAYVQYAPAYIVYRERTHITAPTLGRSQDINRFVQVRQADNFAVMQDLPQGAQRTGQAFPIIPYFDPFTQFTFSWFANLRRVDITLQRSPPGLWPLPQPDASVDVVVPYFSFWQPVYAADSSATRIDIRIAPTPLLGDGIFPSQVVEDPRSLLPAHIEMRTTAGDEVIALDYQVVQNHWIVTHGSFSSTQRVGPLTFTVVADTVYDQFAFPATAPNPLLATPPSPAS
ncbi:MAG TPA: hypothetical protein VGR69_06250 [Candidatus Rubrimentiphilum sp.]|nr:hypothetical protein [Candidatus Rubrimentiphilum sp.]